MTKRPTNWTALAIVSPELAKRRLRGLRRRHGTLQNAADEAGVSSRTLYRAWARLFGVERVVLEQRHAKDLCGARCPQCRLARREKRA